MNFVIKKSSLSGRVRIPGSKSHTIRGIICGTLAGGRTRLENALFSDDTLACMKACMQFGARIEADKKNNKITIQGTGGLLKTPDNIIDAMNSGTTLYFTMGLASLVEGWTFFTGDHQIRNRPAGEMMKALRSLKAKAFSTRGNDKAPLAVQGRARGGDVSLRAKSSQYLSSLLLSAPLFPRRTRINVLLLNEKPYVDMTLLWLKRSGITVIHKSEKLFEIPPKQRYRPRAFKIPSDFSSAAFFIVGSALFAEGHVIIEGPDIRDVQGDKAIISSLTKMGAHIKTEKNRLIIRKSSLRGIPIDIRDTPDLFPVLAVAGCFAEGETVIYNGEHVREKETDRISAMAGELKKMGASVKETPDGMIIRKSRLSGSLVSGHGDHRIVMSLAVAGLGSHGQTVIKGAEAASVTFPNFFDLMKSLKAKIKIF